MIPSAMADRPIIQPRHYFNALSSTEGTAINGNPVCISLETYSAGIEEFLSAASTTGRQSRRSRVSVIG